MTTDQASKAYEASAKTLEALKTALYLAFKLFEKHHEQPPPTPDNLATHVPCQVLITRHRGKGQRITGRIQFVVPSGGTSYDKEWTIR